MNDADFKRHLKALAHGHHHPEEHDWETAQGATPKKARAAKPATKTRSRRKAAKRK